MYLKFFLQKFFPKKILTPEKILHDRIPFTLQATASYDPTTDMYRIQFDYPAEILDPLLDASPHIQLTFPSRDVRARKDALIHHLFSQ
jgi:hypothetical protein